jgi:hypothetical protein
LNFPASANLGIAEVVGSTPTRSISFCEGTTVLQLACFKQLWDKTPSGFSFVVIAFLVLLLMGYQQSK